MPVDYLASIDLVADDHGRKNSFEQLTTDLYANWRDLENHVESNHYNIFLSDPDLSTILSTLLTLLYRLPNNGHKHDVRMIREKDQDYGGSWQKRGGQGAFMMLARKWDRIEKQAGAKGSLEVALKSDDRTEGIQDDLDDLRCYLILVIAWRRSERSSLYLPEIADSVDDMPF